METMHDPKEPVFLIALRIMRGYLGRYLPLLVNRSEFCLFPRSGNDDSLNYRCQIVN